MQSHPPARPLLVIGCGATKHPEPAPMEARLRYTGSLFRAARRYAESQGHPWVILSAKFGLLRPDDLIEDYDLSMKDRLRQPPDELASYKAEVTRQWVELLAEDGAGAGCDHIEIHAGEDYAALMRALSPLPVTAPLAGLTIGRRLQRYAQLLPSSAEGR